MDYELAKQLKDAGFPQKDLHCFIWNLSRGKKYPSYEWCEDPDCMFDNKNDWVMAPTLSELIEAVCMKLEGRFTLRVGDKCIAGELITLADGETYPEDWVIFEEGKTPEEAVARLWLKLNEVK